MLAMVEYLKKTFSIFSDRWHQKALAFSVFSVHKFIFLQSFYPVLEMCSYFSSIVNETSLYLSTKNE